MLQLLALSCEISIVTVTAVLFDVERIMISSCRGKVIIHYSIIQFS